MQYISKDIMLDMLDYIRHQAEFIIETTENPCATGSIPGGITKKTESCRNAALFFVV